MNLFDVFCKIQVSNLTLLEIKICNFLCLQETCSAIGKELKRFSKCMFITGRYTHASFSDSEMTSRGVTVTKYSNNNQTLANFIIKQFRFYKNLLRVSNRSSSSGKTVTKIYVGRQN